MRSPSVKKILPLVFYSLIIVFVYIYISSIDFQKIFSIQINWMFLVAAVFVGLIARYWNALIWLILLSTLGAKDLYIHIKELLYVYAKSWMGRYIPGTAPWILGKIYFASKLGIPKNKLAVGSLLEAALQVLVFIGLSLILLLLDNRLSEIRDQYTALLVLSILFTGVAILPPVFNFVMSLTYRVVKRKQMNPQDRASFKSIHRGVTLFVISSFINGVSLFLIARSIDASVGIDDLLFIMGAGNLASAIGMLAFFAPSGIGVREGIQLLLLSVIISPVFALAIVVMSRIIEIVADVLFFVISRYIGRGLKLR